MSHISECHIKIDTSIPKHIPDQGVLKQDPDFGFYFVRFTCMNCKKHLSDSTNEELIAKAT